MVDIQSVTAEIRRGKEEERRRRKKPQDKNIMSASATQGGHKKQCSKLMLKCILCLSVVVVPFNSATYQYICTAGNNDTSKILQMK